ncbi:hypothetical protein [Aeromonas caviae]|uniref:hypothetical protein n=1 Tax=Aeromonas caviae TaxID=648 RepID=UPI0011476BD0|nr:hypothetical protein [Aeromonas caviae]
MKSEGCPICGFIDITVLDESNCTTFDICEYCGAESGFDYDQHSTSEHFAKIRHQWVETKHCTWWGSKKSIPLNWDPKKQMALANIEMSLYQPVVGKPCSTPLTKNRHLKTATGSILTIEKI